MTKIKVKVKTATVKTGFTIHSSNWPTVTGSFDEYGNFIMEQADEIVVIPSQAFYRFKNAVFKLQEVQS